MTMLEQLKDVPIMKVERCPDLERMLNIIRHHIVQQHDQPGGPGPENVMNLTISCENDPILRQVIELKGGHLIVNVRLAPTTLNETEEQRNLRESLNRIRAQHGITAPAGMGS